MRHAGSASIASNLSTRGPAPRQLPASVAVIRRRAPGVLLLATLLAAGACARAAATPPALLISGAGDGHGVGLSQEGALGYAEHGYGYAAILAHYYTGTTLAPAPPGRNVRVLLASGHLRLTVSGASRADGHRLSARASYAVSAAGGTLVLRSRGHGLRAARLVVRGTGALRVGGLGGSAPAAYRGSLEILAAGGGLEVINLVALDDYTRGVVAEEASPSWPLAALEVQAVASRSYALSSHERGGADGFDVYADTRSQDYGGVAAETPSTNAAVAATAGTGGRLRRQAGHHVLLRELGRLHREHRGRLSRSAPGAVAARRPRSL